MSYDLRVSVKVQGCDKYADIDRPEYDSPTYNLRDMFVACMDWDYEQGVYYSCKEYLPKILHGIQELHIHRAKYEKYNPPNGWGDINSAINALESWRDCIYDHDDIPIECLYIRW